MKKYITMLAMLSGFLMSFSQNNSSVAPPAPIVPSKFSLGITGGFGHSFIAPYRNYALNPSWNSGVSAVYAPSTHWGVGLDVTYSSEGATFTNGELDFTKTLNYIRIPLKAIYYFNQYKNDFRPKVSIGPTMGLLVGGNYQTSTTSSFDLGANFSAGFNYRLIRAVWLTADIVYYQGFLDVASGNDNKDLNGNVRANFGLSFGF